MNWQYQYQWKPTTIRTLAQCQEHALATARWNGQKRIRARYGFIPAYPGQKRQSDAGDYTMRFLSVEGSHCGY